MDRPLAIPLFLTREARAWFWLAFAIVLALGLYLRFPYLDASLWLDELHTDWVTADGLELVAGRAAEGNQPPLYFWLIRMVRWAWDSEVAMRLPSLVASCTLPLVMVGLAWVCRAAFEDGKRPLQGDAKGSGVLLDKADTGGKPIARTTPDPVVVLLAVWWWATDDAGVFFGQEARPYAIVQLVGLLQFAAAWLLTLGRPSQPVITSRLLPRAAFWLLSLLLIYLHYTAALLLVGELVAYLAWRCLAQDAERPAYGGWALAFDISLFLVLLIPCLPQVAGIFAHRDDWRQFVSVPNLGTLIWQYPALVASLLLLAIGRGKWSPRLLIVLTYLGPLLLTLAATWLGIAPLFFPRYLAAVAPLGWLVLALLPTSAKSQAAKIALTLVVTLIPFATSQQLQHLLRHGKPYSEHTEDWRGAMERLNAEIYEASLPHSNTPLRALLVGPRLIEAQRLNAQSNIQFRSYCLFPVNGRYFCWVENARAPLAGPPWRFAAAKDRDVVIAHGGAWVIVRIEAEQVADSQAQLATQFEKDEFIVEQDAAESFGGVQVWRLRVARR